MGERLAGKPREILNYIKDCVRSKGYPPSVREIGEAVGLSSSSTVHGHLARLEERGYIRRDPTKPRAIEVLEPDLDRTAQGVVNLPLVGRVAAGTPILAVENIDDIIPFPSDLVGEGELFLLHVQGNSMIEAGIFEGDYVIVRRQPAAADGEIVVALLEDEATVKRFYRERDHIRLQPENSLMDPIRCQDVTILGKVVGLYRRMH